MEKLKDYSLLLTVFFVYAILFTFDISGVRVSFYQIFQLIFISLSLLAFLKNNKQIVSDNIVHKEYLLIFLIFIFLIKIISGFFEFKGSLICFMFLIFNLLTKEPPDEATNTCQPLKINCSIHFLFQ